MDRLGGLSHELGDPYWNALCCERRRAEQFDHDSAAHVCWFSSPTLLTHVFLAGMAGQIPNWSGMLDSLLRRSFVLDTPIVGLV